MSDTDPAQIADDVARRALVALWEIRMEAERSTVDDDPNMLVSRIIRLAEGGMAGHRQEAQRLAHNDGVEGGL